MRPSRKASLGAVRRAGPAGRDGSKVGLVRACAGRRECGVDRATRTTGLRSVVGLRPLVDSQQLEHESYLDRGTVLLVEEPTDEDADAFVTILTAPLEPADAYQFIP